MANNLTARQIQTAKPKDKLYRLSDGGNLYFCVRPSNSRSWQFRYKRPGQDKITYLWNLSRYVFGGSSRESP